MAAVDSCEKLQINFIVILCVQEYNALRFLIVFCSYVRFHKFYEKHLEVIVKNTIRIFCLLLAIATLTAALSGCSLRRNAPGSAVTVIETAAPTPTPAQTPVATPAPTPTPAATPAPNCPA